MTLATPPFGKIFEVMSEQSLGTRVSNLKSIALTVLELLSFNSHDRPLRTHTQTDRQTNRNEHIISAIHFVHLAEIMIYSSRYALRTIRTSDYSYPGLFVLWVDYSCLGQFVRWTFRTTDYSYYGLFVPSVKYSHNCWCEKALTVQAVYGSVHRFRDVTTYWSKIAEKTQPTLIWHVPLG